MGTHYTNNSIEEPPPRRTETMDSVEQIYNGDDDDGVVTVSK